MASMNLMYLGEGVLTILGIILFFMAGWSSKFKNMHESGNNASEIEIKFIFKTAKHLHPSTLGSSGHKNG